MMQAVALAVFGWTEIILIVAVVVLLFGASRLPQIGRGLGEGIREFKKAITGGPEDEEEPRRIDSGDGGTNGD